MWVVPILHPAFILRGNFAEEPAQVLYLKRAKEIDEKGWELFDSSTPPKGAVLKPTVQDLVAWERGVGPRGVTVDIECARRRLRCVGLCRIDDLVPLVVPLLGQGGAHLWSPEDYGSVVRWLQRFLAGPVPKWFHNGLSFDIPILRHSGYDVGGYAGDTLLAHHIAYPEMPKRLAYLANLYLGIGGWKQLVREDDEGENK